MWFSLTGDEEAGCKEEGRKHKKSEEEASLDLKPHAVALWKRVAIIRINIMGVSNLPPLYSCSYSGSKMEKNMAPSSEFIGICFFTFSDHPSFPSLFPSCVEKS